MYGREDIEAGNGVQRGDREGHAPVRVSNVQHKHVTPNIRNTYIVTIIIIILISYKD